MISGYKALEEELTTAYELAGTKFNHNKIVKIIKFLTNKRMVVQESRGIYRFMPDYHYWLSTWLYSKSVHSYISQSLSATTGFIIIHGIGRCHWLGLPVVQTLSCMGSLIPQATNRSFESAKSLSKLIGDKKALFEPFIFSPAIAKTKFVYLIAHRACPLYKSYWVRVTQYPKQ